MFQTYDLAKINTLSERGASLWSYAELQVNQNWFFADCKITDGDESVSSTYLLSKSNQISELFSNPDVSIEAIYIVSPPYLNNQNCWKMDKLNRLSKGLLENEGSKLKVEIYELNNGKSYYSKSDLKNADSIKNITVLFDIDKKTIV